MPDGEIASQEEQGGQMTLGHLLLAIAFFSPAAAVFGQVKHSGGGALRYVVGLPLAICVGGVVVWLSWMLGRFAWLRAQKQSSWIQNATVMSIFVLYFGSIVVADLAGIELASLLIRYVGQRSF